MGDLGDVKPVGAGVFEMRGHFGPGWRMYYVQRGTVLIVMLGGGDKSTQQADIAAAQAVAATIEEGHVSKKTKVADLPDFDFSEHLDSEQAISEYLNAIVEDGDAALLAAALGDIAKARGMAEIALSAGIGREALYKALRPGAQPCFDTIARVCTALGLKLTVQPLG
jgi:probable addiction module antidote protein